MCWIRNQLFLHLSFVICLQCIPHNWRYIYSWWCNKTLGLLLSLVRFIQDQSLVQKSVGFHILCWSHPMCIYGSCLYLYRLFSLFCLKALCIICDGILFLWRKHSSSLRTRAVLFYVPLLHQLCWQQSGWESNSWPFWKESNNQTLVLQQPVYKWREDIWTTLFDDMTYQIYVKSSLEFVLGTLWLVWQMFRGKSRRSNYMWKFNLQIIVQ